jgi:hypothetical protein
MLKCRITHHEHTHLQDNQCGAIEPDLWKFSFVPDCVGVFAGDVAWQGWFGDHGTVDGLAL